MKSSPSVLKHIFCHIYINFVVPTYLWQFSFINILACLGRCYDVDLIFTKTNGPTQQIIDLSWFAILSQMFDLQHPKIFFGTLFSSSFTGSLVYTVAFQKWCY